MAAMFPDTAAQRAAIKPNLTRLFPEFRTGGDFYRQAIRQALKSGLVVLDAGCGQGGIISEFQPAIDHLIGVDIDREALKQNQYLNERLENDLSAISLPDVSVDLIVGEFVLEHLADPPAVLAELKRILKPGGQMIWLTPNIHHPVMALSRLTSRHWHTWWKRSVLHKSEQVHDAYYRVNTPRAINALAHKVGLIIEKLDLAGNPEYLAIAKPMVIPAIRLEKYLYNSHPHRQMYMVVTMVKS